MSRAWGGRRAQALTRLVLERDGYVCHWCGKRATTADHVRPRAQGGTDQLSNLVASCRPCNLSRGDRGTGTGEFGAAVVVVTGPPTAGKTTHIREWAQRGDVVIDLDRLAAALSADEPGHDAPDHVRHVAIGARAAAIERAARLREPVTVWLVHSVPTPDQLAEYRAHRWHVEVIDPGVDVVMARLEAAHRSTAAREAARKWYAQRSRHTHTDTHAHTAAAPSRAW